MITRQDMVNDDLMSLYSMSGVRAHHLLSFKIPDGDEPVEKRDVDSDFLGVYRDLMACLIFKHKLTPREAIAEMNGLSVENARRLTERYENGLRGEVLRSHQGTPVRRNSFFSNFPKFAEKPVSDEDTLWLAIKDHLDMKVSQDEFKMKNAVCELIANSTNPIGYFTKTLEYALSTPTIPHKFVAIYLEMNFDCRRETQMFNEFCVKYIKLKARRDAKHVELMQGLPAEKPVSDDDAMWKVIKSNIDYQDADNDGRNGYWVGGAETEQNVANAMMRKMATSDNPIGYLKKASEYISSRGGSAEFARRNMQVDYWLGNLGGLAQRRKELQEQLEREAQAAADSVRRHGY